MSGLGYDPKLISPCSSQLCLRYLPPLSASINSSILLIFNEMTVFISGLKLILKPTPPAPTQIQLSTVCNACFVLRLGCASDWTCWNRYKFKTTNLNTKLVALKHLSMRSVWYMLWVSHSYCCTSINFSTKCPKKELRCL